MPLRDLIKKADNSIAPDRILEGDQYDIKIDALLGDVIALADALDTRTGSGTAGGDLSGTYPNPLVVKLRGKSIPSAAPTTGDYLNYDGTSWIYVAGTSGPPTGAAGGNLSGSYPNPKVIKVQDEAVSATPPTDGQIWVYDGVTTNSWVPTTLMTLAANAGSIQDAPVAVTAPVDGQALIYNGSSYVPASFPLQKENTLPPPASSVDYISGSAGASAFTTAGGSAALVTVSGTAVSRGASWTAAGTVRFDSTSRPGWILIQPSTDDGANSFIWHYPLTGGSPTDIGLFLVNSFDDYSAKTDIASITFAFSQTLMGSIDTDNAYLVVITSTAVANQWTIATSIKVAGAVTAISSETLTSPTYPCPLICIEKHSSNFRSWFGLDKNSLKQLAADYSGAITPDRLSILVYTKGRPNTVFGINQIIKGTTALL